MVNKTPYVLGIDVGIASLGLALINANDSSDIISGIVRTYSIPEGAAERRLKRGARRGLDRRARRLDRISELLHSNGIGYDRRSASKEILNYSPIKARAKASREKVDLALLSRAVLHMAKHRGSSAFDNLNLEDKDKLATAKAMSLLETEMADKGFKTYGQYLRWREKNNLMTRIDQEKHNDRYGEYAFYPNRDLLKEEFKIIWEQQAQHHTEVLTPKLKQEVYAELFHQRSVTFPPVGNCPYFKEEEKLPRSSRLFQTRRIYEECNNLRFYSKGGERLDYGTEQRDLLAQSLLDGNPLTAAKIKKMLGFESAAKVNMENNRLKKNIEPYPFDVELANDQRLGSLWLDASHQVQDEILNEFANQPDNKKLIEKIVELLDCDTSKAELALDVSLPNGRGSMGLTATTKILEELKKSLISSREAEDLAGISHAMSPDGEIWDKLPYYGEVLLGHTQPAIWVSDYRLSTDTPPNTSQEENEHGRIPNPVVHLALNQIRKTVNRVIKEYGVPEKIHIELARDLNKSEEQRTEIVNLQEANQKANKSAVEKIKEISSSIQINRPNIQKYRLWEEQKHICIYSGDPISCTQLFDGSVEVDHILPRSKVAIDAFSNKLICFKAENAAKSNRPPFQAFSKDKDKWAAIMRRADKLPPQKQRRFSADAMEEYENDPSAWAARYGTDNAYIARLTRQYLSILFGGDQTKIICVSSHIVALLRGKWGLQNILGNTKSGKKYRGDHRHHFIDALVVANSTRSMVQRIQTEAARCEKDGLDVFVERIAPPFGEGKDFYDAVKAATMTNVRLSRKAEHSSRGQMHEDRLLGIVTDKNLQSPNENGSYLCRKKIKLSSYNSLEGLNKVKIQKPVLDLNLAEVQAAAVTLEQIKGAMAMHAEAALEQLNAEHEELSPAEQTKNKITEPKIYKKALNIHRSKAGKENLTVFEFNKLINIKIEHPSNTPQAGYIGGRNHRIDFYMESETKLCWECISVLNANKIGAKKDPFVPASQRAGNYLLWSAHKEDIIEMDDPENPGNRTLFTVAALTDNMMAVVPIFDARATTGEEQEKRQTYNRRLKFYKEGRAQRVVLDEIGHRQFLFPKLS